MTFMLEVQQNRHEEEDNSQVKTIHIPAAGGNGQKLCLPTASKVQGKEGERG